MQLSLVPLQVEQGDWQPTQVLLSGTSPPGHSLTQLKVEATYKEATLRLQLRQVVVLFTQVKHS